MSTPVGTSRVFQALAACHERLQTLSFPSSPDTDRPVEVRFMSRSDEIDAEWVELVGKVDDNEATPVASPGRNEEIFELLIRCASVVPGLDGPEAVARLGEIVAVVESAFKQTTGVNAGQPVPLDLDGHEIVAGGVVRVEVEGFPNSDRGWAASADVYVRVHARI